ncbi:F-box/kelch-repeat protein At3g23880-like [Nicotiana tomentosiformis]|uniref:F-box/kelch-repeat protein At3g23880-like n=1 Tax=Nicotiana tomentosiformis TaxID=4098 RepID=UPI00388CE995
MGTHVQEEIIVDILSRLPVESLMRFKCVSGSWNTLISSCYFRTKHLNIASRNQNLQKLLISQISYKDGEANTSISFSSLSLNIQVVRKLDCPLNYEPKYGRIYCCCDGLFLVGLQNTPKRDPSILLLWNPSTRETIVLPHSDYSTVDRNRYTFGLGFDSSSNDYKVLKVNNEDDTLNEILSVKSGSWRKLANKSCRNNVSCLFMHMDLAFVHGAFHWLGRIQLPEFIVISFNISNETYRNEPLPEPVCLTMTVRESVVSVLKGMLCVYSTYHDGSTFNLWVMKLYGVKESWSKMLTIPAIGVPLTIPKYIFADGEVLLYCEYSERTVFRTSKGPFIEWPDLVRDDINEDSILDVYVYTQSLMSPKAITNKLR